MERDRLICCLVGWYTRDNPSISSTNLKIKLDNHLINSKFTPLGTEPYDVDLLQDLLDETIMSVLGRGFNRKDRRKLLSIQ